MEKAPESVIESEKNEQQNFLQACHLVLEKIWNFIKNHYEIIGYIVLTVLLFLSCFVSIFAPIVAIYVLFFAVLLHSENRVIGLFLFYTCFEQTIGLINEDFFSIYVVKGLELIIALIYLIRLFKKKTKIKWKTLIPIGIFLLYVVMPFHEINLSRVYEVGAFFVIIYIIDADWKQINFKYLVQVFVCGLVISCVLGLFKSSSFVLQEKLVTVYLNGKIRFQGLFKHPNTLAITTVVVFCAVLFLKYKDKISSSLFFIEAVTLFVFGVLTLSRSFLFSVILALTVFVVLYLIKHKVKALPLFAVMMVVICFMSFVFYDQCKSSFDRFDDGVLDYYENFRQSDNETNRDCVNDNDALINENGEVLYQSGVLAGKSKEEVDKIFAGEIFFDPGRKGLWELYLIDWSSSQKTMWLGRGVSKSEIGQMGAHSLYIQLLWSHGIIGCLFYIAIILCLINWKKIRSIKHFLAILIIIIPFGLITVVESRLYDISSFLIILSAFNYVEQLLVASEQKRAQKTNLLLYIIDDQTCMYKMIEDFGVQGFKVDILVKNNSNLLLNNSFYTVNGQVVLLSSKGIFYWLDLIKYLHKNVGNYDCVHLGTKNFSNMIISYLARDVGNIQKVTFKVES